MKKIGKIKDDVINVLGLSIDAGTPIFIGDSNINHMIKKHPKDYNEYGKYITDIIDKPDYVGYNFKNDSIEYVKEFSVNNEFVKVAVRVTIQGNFFARYHI